MTLREITDITDRIYDTLMDNGSFSDRLDLRKVENQEVDAIGGLITFDYNDQTIKIDVSILR
ncbi:hypothetical protein LCGC14_0437460 [marine sediment metagenome]|uniref:Uncharacterized protein n=1 Tax=marine sediment metagenome TaxID=412755 RepID=A0A0F9SLF0_9ZZZZ